MIVQNVGERGKANISFTVPRDELRATLEAVDEAAQQGFDYFVLATTAGIDEVTRNWAAHAARDRGSWSGSVRRFPIPTART